MKFSSAFITGASSGLGRGLAMHYAGKGAVVYAAARRAAELEALAAEFKGRGRIVPVVLDVTDSEELVAAIRAAEAASGGALDLVIVAATCDGMLGIGSDQDWSQLQGTQVASDGLTIEQAEWWTAVRSGTEVSPTISVPSSLTWDAAIAAFRSTQE